MAKVGGWRGRGAYGNGAGIGPAYGPQTTKTAAEIQRAKASMAAIDRAMTQSAKAQPTIVAAMKQRANGRRDRGTGRAIATTFMKLYLSGATFMGGTGKPRPNANRLLSAQRAAGGGGGGRRG